MEVFSAVHIHMHTCTQSTHTHITPYTDLLLCLFYASLPVHISVVVLSIGPIAANVLGGTFSINSSAYTFPQAPTLQDRSFLSFGFQVCYSFSITAFGSVFNGFQ